MPKQYYNTGSGETFVSVILFLAFNSDFTIILNLSVCLIFCVSFVDVVYLQFCNRYAFIGFPMFMVQAMLLRSTQFFDWTNFPFLDTVFAPLSSPNSKWISSLKVLTLCSCFWVLLFSLSASNRPCKERVIFLLCYVL